MRLSIIIVNFNVKYFLEQCLISVKTSSKKIKTEVFIVDNNSTDGSCKMIKDKFPDFHLIRNKKNLGFSKANNQAIKKASGKYILLLNPDTILEEDTLIKCLNFMKKNDDAGSLGVKMIDGNGKFLPESKRSFPKPMIAFYKIFGLSRLFPNSKIFGKYHLSFLDKNKIHEVDVLSGAFLLIKHAVFKKIGLLDEQFFMYGEDIDISYRIKLGGFKNYYFPKTKIIHYKGESTKKTSINYVFLFYKAMMIFSKKHFNHNNALIFTFLIQSAIYFRATLSICKRFLKDTIFSLVDMILIYLGIIFLKNSWEDISMKIIGEQKILPLEFMEKTVPVCIGIWIFFIYLRGGYKNYVKPKNILHGTIIGSMFILITYGLLPEELRSSRVLIVLSSIWTILTLSIYRQILGLFGVQNFRIKKKRIAIIGDKGQFKRIQKLLQSSINNIEHIKHIDSKKGLNSLNDNIIKIIEMHLINEIIFCSKNISFNQIIQQMSFLNKQQISIKIAPEKGSFVIGSNSKNSQGELYTINEKNISN